MTILVLCAGLNSFHSWCEQSQIIAHLITLGKRFTPRWNYSLQLDMACCFKHGLLTWFVSSSSSSSSSSSCWTVLEFDLPPPAVEIPAERSRLEEEVGIRPFVFLARCRDCKDLEQKDNHIGKKTEKLRLYCLAFWTVKEFRILSDMKILDSENDSLKLNQKLVAWLLSR